MFSSLKSFQYNFKNNPLRGLLILTTITTGVATLSVAGGLSSNINRVLDMALSEEGRRISIINGDLDSDGNVVPQGGGRFTPEIFGILESDYENLSDLSFSGEAWIKPIAYVGEKTYQMRSAIHTNETYAELMDLEMVAGHFFDHDDVVNRRPVVVISALAGQMIYGSAEAALGAQFAIAARTGIPPYTVVGLFEDVSDLEREAFGIGDFIFPEASGFRSASRFTRSKAGRHLWLGSRPIASKRRNPGSGPYSNPCMATT